MPRPKCCRKVGGKPNCTIFKPAGAPVSIIEEVVLSMDEFEAIRLADREGLYHEAAAERMNVSRSTFGRILEAARSKVARVLVEGLALRIEGSEIDLPDERTFECVQCRHQWAEPYGTGRPGECPACRGGGFRRIR